jgi:thiamine biosynthesis lipoprotein
VSVHPDTICAVVKAIDSWHRTGGRFDVTARPTTHDGTGHTISATLVPPAPGCRVGTSAPVMVDPARSTITVPAGSAIDLGGLDKGLAADLVADELLAAGATGVLVNVGGDLTVRGVPDDDTSWCLGVDVPSPGSQHTVLVRLVSGGIATSGTPVRRWLADGVVRHHPTYGIDPAAGDRAGVGTLAATVLAVDAATADVFATAAMLLTPVEAVAMLEELGVAGLIVAIDGSVHRTSTLRPFLV